MKVVSNTQLHYCHSQNFGTIFTEMYPYRIQTIELDSSNKTIHKENFHSRVGISWEKLFR